MKKNFEKPAERSEKIQQLAEQVIRHKRLYYTGHPEIADLDYDKLEAELRSLAPEHPVLSAIGSVNIETSNEKIIHESPMLSLDKTYDFNQLLKWASKKEILGTLKVDGTSMSLIYKNGRFSLAKTRGNGREGEDVTAKLKWVSDVILQNAPEFDFEVRGELFCSESNFLELSEEMVSLGLERPSSPRNIVAGILGRKIHGELARFFNFFAFDVIGLNQFKTELEKMNWLEDQRFRLPEPRLLKSPEEIDQYLQHVKDIMADDEIGCDGAVFTYNNLALHDELGSTSHHPRFKLSFKWQGETAKSTIRKIEWATSRLGIVTPVAVIDPVDLSGASISNITLHNAAHVKAYNLKVGDKIELVRSGEVIPKFLRVIQSSEGPTDIPEFCPSCQSDLIFDSVRLKCPNIIGCPAQKAGLILNWIRATGIDDLSDKRLSLMMDRGLVSTIADLYRVKVSDLLSLPSTKEKMATKLFENIQKTKHIPTAMFLNGLGIEGAGQVTWERLLEIYPTLDQVLTLEIPDISAVDGFADRSAGQIFDGLKRNAELINELRNLGVSPIDPVTRTSAASGLLEGMIFVITGALSRSRKDIEQQIKSHGGRVSTSVSKSTTALITNEESSDSSKMVKAKSLGISIWTEDDLDRHLSPK